MPQTLLFFTGETLLPELLRELTRHHRLRVTDEGMPALQGAGTPIRGVLQFIPDAETPQRKVRVDVAFATSIDQVDAALRAMHFDAVIADNRVVDAPRREFAATRVGQLLDRLVNDRALEERLRPGRVVAILSGGPGVAAECFALGRWRVADWVIEPFAEQALLRKVHRLLERSESRHRTALCLAGGGLEGLLYEIGVLRALEGRLRTRSVLDFDIYCGISAGGFLASLTAAGLPPAELMLAFSGESQRLPAIGPTVLYDLFPREYALRLLRAYLATPKLLTQGPAAWYARLLSAVPAGLFKGEALERYLAQALRDLGCDDQFGRLDKELYIGATDQDRTSHVVFGEPGRMQVPISQAVRASAGLPPFYPPREVDGRWYVDGGVTRTTNVEVAIRRGASLVVVIDPLIPVEADAGYVRQRGGFFGAIQAIKGMTHSRFQQVFDGIVERYPDVEVFLFKPDQECRRAMSGSPMRWKIRQEIETLAYQSASAKIEASFDRFQAEFSRFGFVLS